MKRLQTLSPGLVRSALVGSAGLIAAPFVGVSAIPLTLLGGALTPQRFIPPSAEPGLKFASTTVLRAGVVCVGFKLSLLELATLGALGVPCVAASVGAGVFLIPKLAAWMGLDRKLGSLLAIGTSVCGVTAISALAPAVKAEESQVAVAVSNVVLFGAMGMVAYPYLAHHLFPLSPGQAGVFLGLGIHDTSQVVGAAASYSEIYSAPTALSAAVVTKLTRNVCLAAVLPYLSFGGAKLTLAELYRHVPSFVFFFIAASLLRTTGDVFLSSFSLYQSLLALLSQAPVYLLGVAMGAVGLAIRPRQLLGYGWRPFFVGGVGALLVACAGCASAYAIGAAGVDLS